MCERTQPRPGRKTSGMLLNGGRGSPASEKDVFQGNNVCVCAYLCHTVHGLSCLSRCCRYGHTLGIPIWTQCAEVLAKYSTRWDTLRRPKTTIRTRCPSYLFHGSLPHDSRTPRATNWKRWTGRNGRNLARSFQGFRHGYEGHEAAVKPQGCRNCHDSGVKPRLKASQHPEEFLRGWRGKQVLRAKHMERERERAKHFHQCALRFPYDIGRFGLRVPNGLSRFWEVKT